MKTAHALPSGKRTDVAVSAAYSQHNSEGAKASKTTLVKMQNTKKVEDFKSACMKNSKGITP